MLSPSHRSQMQRPISNPSQSTFFLDKFKKAGKTHDRRQQTYSSPSTRKPKPVQSNRKSWKKGYQVPTETKKLLEVEISSIKSLLVVTLLKMTYHEKLTYLEVLLTQAKELASIYGYFYTTFAMIIFAPQHEKKFSLWIHPDLNENFCLHPIKTTSKSEDERKFYINLKKVFFQLFPTISLGSGCNYASILQHIKSLQKSKRKDFSERSTLHSLMSLPEVGKKEIEVLEEVPEENISVIAEEKPECEIKRKKKWTYKYFEEEFLNLFKDTKEVNWYEEESFLTETQKQTVQTVTNQFEKILF